MSLLSVAMGRAESGRLDKMVAALAALAAGAAVFLMPGGVLEQAVRASGMPDYLPQLSPPLGIKSRAGLALLSAGSAFGMALLMMRLLGLAASRKSEPVRNDDEGAPRVRRRDRHPDAPVRAPLSVSRDLGEPASAPQPKAELEPEPRGEPEPWSWRETEREPEPESLPRRISQPRMAKPATRRRAPLIEVLGDIHDAAEAAPAAPEPHPVEPEAVVQEPEEASAPIVRAAPEPEPEPEPEAETETAAQPVWLAPQADSNQRGQESLADLLSRFERALERKIAAAAARGPSPVAADAAAAAAAPEEEGMDLRLRSALENLRRFAPRHG